jgi:hypothetical protein
MAQGTTFFNKRSIFNKNYSRKIQKNTTATNCIILLTTECGLLVLLSQHWGGLQLENKSMREKNVFHANLHTITIENETIDSTFEN